jgi:hypothetical protein
VIAEIVSLPAYETQAAALLEDEERMAMEYFIASAPENHPVIPGSGGFRKARWGLGRQREEWWRSRDLLFRVGTGASFHGCGLREIAQDDAIGRRSKSSRQNRRGDQKAVKRGTER